MMLKSATIVLVCFMGIISATPVELPMEKVPELMEKVLALYENDEPIEIVTMNQMADTVLLEVRKLIGEMGMDPMQLPDVHKNFSFKPVIITYHGELDLTRGWVQEVSDIWRNGDVKMDYGDHIITLQVPIKFNQFLFNYDYNMKLMNLGPDGGVEGKVVDIEIYISLSMDFNKLKITLNTFDIAHIGKIKVKFTNNGLVDWIVNLLTGLVTSIFKGLVTNVAEGIVRHNLVTLIDLINEILANIKPLPAPEGTTLNAKSAYNLIQTLENY